MAKKKTSKKKPAPKKPPTKKKASASKAPARKKPAAKKKVSKKKKAPAAKKKAPATKKKSTTKKKTTAKKKAVTKKKTTTKKKAAATTKKKKASSAKKGAAKSDDASNNGEASANAAKTTKKTKSKSTAVKIGRGRSVAEVASTATADEQGYVIINGRRVRMISTKGVAAAAKKTRTTAVKDAEVATDKPPKPIKTKLNKRQLEHYQKLLFIKRAEIVGDLSAMEAEALRSSDGDLSNMPIHMADLGSDTYEQDLMLGMAQNERERLREIDEALQRIAERTYGICMMTHEPIPKARLEAKPWAKYTIEAARKLEGSWGPR